MVAICGVSPAFRVRYAPNSPHRRRPPPPPPPAALAVTSESRGGRMFVFGMGFVGRYVSERLKQEGWKVSGTCRSADKKIELEEMGLDAYVFDTHKSKVSSLTTLPHATHVLVSIPPILGFGDPMLSIHNDLKISLGYGNLQWLCYLSTTSVYGDCGGAWVDEDYLANPKKESAKSRLTAEKEWLNLGHELGVTVTIFRLGGIYGPGRSALDTIIKQKSMSKEQKMRESKLYTARVHVADIYQAIKASFEIPISGRIYNVVDDEPAPRAEVFAYANSLIQRSRPGMISEVVEFVPGDEVDLSIQRGEKRVSNTRLKEELGVKLLHPTYRSGLQSILDSGEPNYKRP